MCLRLWRQSDRVNRVQGKARHSWLSPASSSSSISSPRRLPTGSLFLATQPHEQVHSKLSSHLVMRDKHLTLLDIMERDIPLAEFAFLSACHTAVDDEETPDMVHLAPAPGFGVQEHHWHTAGG
ncbi:hypothetical protein BDR04DRAFT_1105351 [Suillus decipiens]|nr:hypothetical protein BDR04DRAFT_1105351 [Suillus decipiens]